MDLKDKLKLINNSRARLPVARRRTLNNYKRMCHNIIDEGGGESHVSPAEEWADKIIAAYHL